jgi:hypothetical protein
MSSGIVGALDLSTEGRPEAARRRGRTVFDLSDGIRPDPDCYLDSSAAAERVLFCDAGWIGFATWVHLTVDGEAEGEETRRSRQSPVWLGSACAA